MKIQNFEMERWQSTWENIVEYNLTESGVHPVNCAELGISGDELLNQRLGYGQSNGSIRFRELASELYEGASVNNFVATIGGCEANFHCMSSLIEPGDEAVFILPNYMQTYGAAEAFGATIVPVWTKPENEWIPDPDEIADKVTSKTRLISISNPNNPTGAAYGLDTLKAIAAAADKVGCWIHSDEVYRGAEREGDRTHTMWGVYPKTLVVHSMSKSYGMPGTRLGWVLGPPDAIEKIWSHKDYTSIAPCILADKIACHGLEQRDKLRLRTQEFIGRNLPFVEEWMALRPGMFELVKPKAAAIAMIRYKHPIESYKLAARLREEESTLIVPGQQFMLDGYFRLGFGPPRDYLEKGLERVLKVFDSTVD
jgi:aspartate/methionine/tyrosine aminotransferase